MLGRALGREFPEAERFTRAALDITDVAALRAALAPDTRLVLNAAADTRVDAAESDPHHVLVNAVAVGALAALCRKLDATFVHVSTDYVFSGKGIRPYREDDPVDPVNAYGRAKLMGERRTFEEGHEVLVVRSSWVFGMGGVNFVDTILKRVEGGARDLSVVNDQVAPGAAVPSLLAALTPWLTSVPMTMPTLSVNRIKVNESTFCVRNLSNRLMESSHSSVCRSRRNPHRAGNYYFYGCGRRWNGFISTKSTPLKMSAAPAAACPDRPSPAIENDVIQATTGSSA